MILRLALCIICWIVGRSPAPHIPVQPANAKPYTYQTWLQGRVMRKLHEPARVEVTAHVPAVQNGEVYSVTRRVTKHPERWLLEVRTCPAWCTWSWYEVSRAAWQSVQVNDDIVTVIDVTVP